MKCTDLASAYKTLAAFEEPYRSVLIECSDDFFRADCLERYCTSWKTRVSNGDVRRRTLSELVALSKNIQGERSLFGTQTLHVVEHVEGKKGEELCTLIGHATEDNYFAFTAEEAAPADLREYIASTGLLIHLPSLKPWERLPLVARWIHAFVQKRGATIVEDAANVLAQGYSSDRLGLIQELEKLLAFKLNEPTISLEDIHEIGIVEVQPSLWNLLDGLLAGNSHVIAETMLDQTDMHDIAIIRFLQNQLERLLMAVETGAPSRNKSQERQMAACRRRGSAVITSWINRLKMQEVAIRTGQEDACEGSLLPFLLSLVT
jgi:DNA polymerase III delta subunit